MPSSKETLNKSAFSFPGLKPLSIYQRLDAGLKASSTTGATCSEFPEVGVSAGVSNRQVAMYLSMLFLRIHCCMGYKPMMPRQLSARKLPERGNPPPECLA